MGKTVFQQKKFFGFSDYVKETIEPDHYFYAQSIDYRSDPQGVTLLPAPLKESGTIVSDLLKCGAITPYDLSFYSYGNAGNIYKRTISGSWSALRTINTSHGNGMEYFAGDDYLYYSSDKAIGRYGPISGTPQFSDDFLGSMGGSRLNTYSAILVSASSQYASRADTATLSITGDITLECYINPTTLPASGSTMTLISKWDESGALRSYKFDIAGVSASFGDGSDGVLTISVNTTEAPIDSACSGTSGTYSLSATNVSFAAGQKILIHQSQGTNAGAWQITSIVAYTAGTITTQDALIISFVSGAQVRVLKQYSAVTVNAGITWTCKAWNGTVGGILAFLCNGALTVSGNIVATGCGFRGGQANTVNDSNGWSGEGTLGVSAKSPATNGNGAGGGVGGSGLNNCSGGGGGGNATAGANGGVGQQYFGGGGGYAWGNNQLTTMVFGGGGSSGGMGRNSAHQAEAGGNGGGIIFTQVNSTTITGSIVSNGINGTSYSYADNGGGGGGAGGSILMKSATATLGTTIVTANGGSGGAIMNSTDGAGGDGSAGRIHLDCYTSYTGTTSPTLDFSQDNNLSNNTTYQLRFSVSSTGSNSEIMTRQCNLTAGAWKHVAVTWISASHISEFFLNGNSLGTSLGTFTAIHDNASTFQIGMYKNATVPTAFYNGEIDDVRVWNAVRSAANILVNKDIQIAASTVNLQAYYQLNNNWTDATANGNDLTPANAPTFTADVPFLSPSTRLDIDLSQIAAGQTYTVPTTITESGTNMVSFTPTKDPLKSISVLVATKGTGNWTLTLHDFSNTVVSTVTITNANLFAGVQNEFIFSSPIRFQLGATYHFHLTSTVADGTLTTNTNANLSTVGYYTYFQYLVTDTQFHPIVPLLNFMVIGNERYLATWNGVFYSPNQISFPPQTRVRSFTFWREYLAIATWREATTGTPNIYDWSTGRIYFWDGISLTFNFYIDVPDGQVNAMLGNNNLLYICAGYNGDLSLYQGGYSTGSGNSPTTKIKRIPLQSKSDYLEIYPGAMAMWRSLIHMGVAANSNSTSISRGVYSWGTLNVKYPDSLSLDYIPSTGSIGSTVKIGLVFPVGQTLLVGWQDGTSFGCDQVNFNNRPASYGTIQTLLQDEGTIWHQSAVLKMKADYNPLRTGESISIKYSINRGSFVSMDTPDSTVGKTNSILQISNGRHQEYQLGVDMYSSGTTSPTLLGISALNDGLSEELTF